jgi:hypothetical protein
MEERAASIFKVECAGTSTDIRMKTASIANLSEPMGIRRAVKTFLGLLKMAVLRLFYLFLKKQKELYEITLLCMCLCVIFNKTE